MTATAPPSPCELLEWDSRHFGFRIARVPGPTLDEPGATLVDEWCTENDVRCLYLLADPEDAQTARVAAKHGFRVVDLRLTARRSLAEEPTQAGPAGVEVGEAREAELGYLRSLAGGGYRGTGRFYFDGGFPPGRRGGPFEARVGPGSDYPGGVIIVGRGGGGAAALP